MTSGADLVDALTRGTNDGDVAAIDAIFAPDASLAQYLHPGGVVRSGSDALRHALGVSESMFTNVRVEPSEVMDAGQRLGFLLTASMPDLEREGEVKPVALARVFMRVRDGKVADMVVFGRPVHPND
jgi:ketosteroid isomerase-like protein